MPPLYPQPQSMVYKYNFSSLDSLAIGSVFFFVETVYG